MEERPCLGVGAMLRKMEPFRFGKSSSGGGMTFRSEGIRDGEETAAGSGAWSARELLSGRESVLRFGSLRLSGFILFSAKQLKGEKKCQF